MRNKPPFDPCEQIETTLGEFDRAMIEARACVDRAERLRQKIADELAAAREERDRLEIYTEDEAAAILRITPTHLADVRRRHRAAFPHCVFGNQVRYTKEHLSRIVAMFENRPAAGQIRRAA